MLIVLCPLEMRHFSLLRAGAQAPAGRSSKPSLLQAVISNFIPSLINDRLRLCPEKMKCVLYFLILVHNFPMVNEDFYPPSEQRQQKKGEKMSMIISSWQMCCEETPFRTCRSVNVLARIIIFCNTSLKLNC